MAVTLPAQSFAADSVYTALFSNRAAGGHDVVAYFTDGAPREGKKSISTRHDGAEWLLATEANRALFVSDPNKYAPHYGVYCAWAVSQGYTASGDPQNWTIQDGKLYLNYNDDVQATWEADKARLIRAADENWPKVLD
jgi:hypothetical protein